MAIYYDDKDSDFIRRGLRDRLADPGLGSSPKVGGQTDQHLDLLSAVSSGRVRREHTGRVRQSAVIGNSLTDSRLLRRDGELHTREDRPPLGRP